MSISWEEKWQTICNWTFHLKLCEVHKKSMDVKPPLLFVLLVLWSRADLDFKQQFDNMFSELIATTWSWTNMQ